MFSIGITTFERRYPLLEEMVRTIRSIDAEIEIILAVNGKYEKQNNSEYLKNIYELAASYPNIYVFNFPRFTGLAKMWNTIVINSSSEYNLILNDDLRISNMNFIVQVNEIISKSKLGFFKVNGSFCHFVISKQMLNQLNYFDERLLAYGEEDGDMSWKYLSVFKRNIPIKKIQLFENIGEGYGLPHEEIGVQDLGGVYRPIFNRRLLHDELYEKSFFGIKGMFDYKMKKKGEEKQYPYEKFKMDNYSRLKKED
jgi:glycosyltransferase involved in cell wall biosynthesis